MAVPPPSHRVRDKNLRAGEAPPALFPGSGGASNHVWPSPQRQQHQHQQQADTTPQRQRRNCRFEEACAARPRGGSNVGGLATRQSGGGGWMGGGIVGGAGSAAGPEAAVGSEGDRNRVLLILRRLEDHGRVRGKTGRCYIYIFPLLGILFSWDLLRVHRSERATCARIVLCQRKCCANLLYVVVDARALSEQGG